MQECVHGTDQAAIHCPPCFLMKRIAKETKGMLEARQVYLDRILAGTPEQRDEAQYVMHDRLKALEQSVKEADALKLFG